MTRSRMRRVIVGTAGHIDHGKTSLVLALTGIDCDRWAEEKARGITIDLGFAHLTEGDLQVGFVDVPGHERFLHNALAGLGGIRVMLLVVAADEGVKPQTREHLAVCSLLGIPAGLVALTKADLVAAGPPGARPARGRGAASRHPVRGRARPPRLQHHRRRASPSSRRRSSISRRSTPRRADPEPAGAPARRPRLPPQGAGGGGHRHARERRRPPRRHAGGAAARGDGSRVRSVQVHGQPRERGRGRRAHVAPVHRRPPGGPRPAACSSARPRRSRPPPACSPASRCCRTPPRPCAGFVPVRLHLYASEVIGRLRPLAEGGLAPGETGPVEIRLEAPVSAVRGDRYVLRRPSPAATLGGGEILDPRWRRHRGAILAQALSALQGDLPAALAFWVQEAGERGAEAAGAGAPAGRCRRRGWRRSSSALARSSG